MASKKCLVFETLGKISDLQRITESADGFMRLHGVFGVCGVKNNNNRIYNKKNYGLMVENLQHEITQGSVLGELEHPNSMNITLDNVSHMIESIEMNEDGTVTGTIKILDTPKGRIARAIAEASGSLYISSRAAGSIDESGNVTLTMLKTYDLVGTPGFSQAKLTLAKGQKFESLCESVDDGNISWMIIEGDDSDDSDDLLSSGDDKDKDKKSKSDDDKSDDKKDDDSDDKKKDDDSDDKKDDDSDDKSDKEKDNNKNTEDKVTMDKLKEAIDALKDQVESLQADLHVAKESLAEKDGEITQLTEKLDAIQSVNYNAIEDWVNEEFAPSFKEQLLEEIDENINESIENATQSIAEGVENWTLNEFAPIVENWTINEFAPVVEGWVTEEFAPVVESYITEEFAPVVEGWINEELMPTVDSWINEVCIPEHKEAIINEVNCNVNEFLESKADDKLSSIDNLLEAIEQKGTADAALELLKEQHTDNKFKGVYCVENMPAEFVPQWTMCSEAKQNEIVRSSRMYDFTKAGILENFWASVDFTEKQEPIVENQTPASNYHDMIFNQAMRLRK